MNKTPTLSIIAVIFLLLASNFPPAAQTSPDQLKGKQIRSEQGEKLGTIEDIMVGPDGKIEAVIVKKGGILGFGGEENRIAWNDLKQGGDPDYLVYIPGGQKEGDGSGGYLTETSGEERENTQVSAEQKLSAESQKQAEFDQQAGQQGSGQVLVKQPGAKVEVDQSEPQVQVKQSEPEVQVQQEPPQVTVKQPAPQIEVTVKQPEPEVSVQQQQPAVDVQQEEPMVSVQQEKPEVEVEQEKPHVTVQKSEPEVQVEDSGQAQIYVEEQEQAQVEIEKQGEPQVDVITGQQQKEDRQQMAQRQQELQLKTFANIDPSEADEWLGQELVGKAGETLGTVKMNYLSEDRNSVLYLIVQGDENKMHPVPADVVRIDPDKNELMAEIDTQTFQDSPNFSEQEKPQLDQQEWSQEIRAYYGQEGGQSGTE